MGYNLVKFDVMWIRNEDEKCKLGHETRITFSCVLAGLGKVFSCENACVG